MTPCGALTGFDNVKAVFGLSHAWGRTVRQGSPSLESRPADVPRCGFVRLRSLQARLGEAATWAHRPLKHRSARNDLAHALSNARQHGFLIAPAT